MKIKTLLYIGLGIGTTLLAIYGVISILIQQGKINPLSIWSLLKKWGGIAGLTTIAIIALVFFIDWIMTKKYPEKPYKEFVNSSEAVKIWLQAFLEQTQVPCYVDYSKEKKGELKPLKDNYLEFNFDDRGFSHKTTGNKFHRFEINCRAGLRQGYATVILDLSRGKDFVKNNWNSFITPRSMDMLNLNEREFPLDTPEEEASRFTSYKIDKLEEGELNEKELKLYEASKQTGKKQDTKEEDEDKKEIEKIKEAKKLMEK